MITHEPKIYWYKDYYTILFRDSRVSNQISITKNLKNMVYSCNGILFSNLKEQANNTALWVNLQNTKEETPKKSAHKVHIARSHLNDVLEQTSKSMLKEMKA